MRKIYEIEDRKKLEKFIKKEGNFKKFKYKGFECRIIRSNFLNGGKLIHLCGYVALPKNHNLYGVSYMNHQTHYLRVHYGLTFSDFDILEKNGEDKRSRFWWIGFDCGHARDISDISFLGRAIYDAVQKKIRSLMTQIPNYSPRDLPKYKETYKTMNYVERELKKLVDQL